LKGAIIEEKNRGTLRGAIADNTITEKKKRGTLRGV
jgi:hypothetical protein